MKRDDIVEYKFKRYYEIIKTCTDIQHLGELKLCNHLDCAICCVENCPKITIREMFEGGE